MLSTFIFFLFICALSVNDLAACQTHLPANCNCIRKSFESYYSCKDEKNSRTNLTVPHWEGPLQDVVLSCEEDSVSKEWYNSLKGIKEEIGGAGIHLRVIFEYCPIPDESINEYLVEKVGLSIITSEITRLHLKHVKNFDSSFSNYLFANLPKLKIVHFENTNLQHIPSNFFQPLSNISSFSTIILNKNNNLSRVNFDTFKNLELLQRIDLSENNLSQLEDGTFSKLHMLQDLCLNGNQLNQLSGDIFKDVTDLQYLYLQNNNLTTLTRKVFTPVRYLWELNLESNGITTLDVDVFEDLNRLRILNLASNNISSTILPKLISNMPNLEKIFLDKNGITQLAENTFSKSQKLEKVFLKNNLLAELPNSLFQNSVKLREIHLSYNKLITLKETLFQKLEDLKQLYLDNNELTFIPANTFKDLKNLLELSLHNNRLTSLPDALFQNVGVVVQWLMIEITLDNNPWECNCDGKYLLSFLKNSSKVLIPRENKITCAKSGLAVNSLSLQELCPETQITYT